jgi:hypothetical protein
VPPEDLSTRASFGSVRFVRATDEAIRDDNV